MCFLLLFSSCCKIDAWCLRYLLDCEKICYRIGPFLDQEAKGKIDLSMHMCTLLEVVVLFALYPTIMDRDIDINRYKFAQQPFFFYGARTRTFLVSELVHLPNYIGPPLNSCFHSLRPTYASYNYNLLLNY